MGAVMEEYVMLVVVVFRSQKMNHLLMALGYARFESGLLTRAGFGSPTNARLKNEKSFFGGALTMMGILLSLCDDKNESGSYKPINAHRSWIGGRSRYSMAEHMLSEMDNDNGGRG
jgi:hypothetical protein